MLSRVLFKRNLSKSLTKYYFSTKVPPINSKGPSNRNVVLIKGLPLTATSENLGASLAHIENVRKIEVEPGCALHFLSEADAEYSASKIRSEFNCYVCIFIFDLLL